VLYGFKITDLAGKAGAIGAELEEPISEGGRDISTIIECGRMQNDAGTQVIGSPPGRCCGDVGLWRASWRAGDGRLPINPRSLQVANG